jgi:hypothetical protein
MMKLVQAMAGEQKTVSAKTSAKSIFLDINAMHFHLGSRKYLTDVLLPSPWRLQGSGSGSQDTIALCHFLMNHRPVLTWTRGFAGAGG